MTWQDAVFAIGNAVFALALIPTIRGTQKPHLVTSVLTALTLWVFSAAQWSLGLWLAGIVTMIEGGLWVVLAVQRMRVNVG